MKKAPLKREQDNDYTLRGLGGVWIMVGNNSVWIRPDCNPDKITVEVYKQQEEALDPLGRIVL